MLYIIFGLPGSGKTFVGKIFKDFGFYFYDGDNELTEEMKQAIQKKITFTDEMRDEFFNNLIFKIKELKKSHPKLIIAQTFIKEKYRKMLLDQIPEARFILIKAEDEIRENRLKKRTDSPLDIEYSRKMCRNFDAPQIPYQIILNNTEGEESIKRQIDEIASSASGRTRNDDFN